MIMMTEQGKPSQAIEGKIFTALERLSDAFRVLLLHQAKSIGASPMQLKILIFLHQQDIAYCQPSYLATELNVTKATLSDSMKSMESKGWIIKVPNVKDSRSYSVQLTQLGEQLVEKTIDFSRPLIHPIEQIGYKDKENLYTLLLTIISSLNDQGVISLERNCFKCRFYKGNKDKSHYCSLLNKEMQQSDLRLDCPEHETAVL